MTSKQYAALAEEARASVTLEGSPLDLLLVRCAKALDEASARLGRKEKAAAFVPPTAAEVQEEIQKRGGRYLAIDAEEFVSHYQANGWVQGNKWKPVKDWRACLTTWGKGTKGFSQKPGAPTMARPSAEENAARRRAALGENPRPEALFTNADAYRRDRWPG